ncbi:MAG: hypothetical protein ACE5HA_16745 [Anaerolineae bacterium]
MLAAQPAGPPLIPRHLHQPAFATQTCAGFHDEFSAPPLDPGWSWINEGSWSLTERPGYLRIYTEQTETDPTYLLRNAPDGVDVVWSHLEVQPAAVFQQAGIAVYQDDSNHLRLVQSSAFGQLVAFVLETHDEVQVQSTTVGAGILELRIEKLGTTYIGYYRTDAELIEVGRFEDVDFSTPRTGLVATAGESGASPVDFDDFCLEPFSAGTGTPTPTTEPPDLTLAGQVYDATDGPGHGVSGATVSVLTCEPRRFPAQTWSDGSYELLVPAPYLAGCNQVTLEVWATGYETLSQTIAVDDLYAQPRRDFALTPRSPTLYLPMILTDYAAPTPTPTPTAPPTPIPPPIPTPTLMDIGYWILDIGHWESVGQYPISNTQYPISTRELRDFESGGIIVSDLVYSVRISEGIATVRVG